MRPANRKIPNPRTQIPSKLPKRENPKRPNGGLVWLFGILLVCLGFGFWELGFPPLAVVASVQLTLILTFSLREKELWPRSCLTEDPAMRSLAGLSPFGRDGREAPVRAD